MPNEQTKHIVHISSLNSGRPKYLSMPSNIYSRGENMNSTIRKMTLISTLVVFSQFSFASAMTFSKLVGKWTSEQLQPSGDTIAVQLEITSDHIFSGIVFENRIPVWTYAGTCELNGNELTWTYLHSTRPLEPNMQDTDVVDTINEQQFTYTSKSSGESGSYERVQ